MTTEPILDIQKLVVRFPDKTVLKDIDWTIQKGDMVSLIGVNGAGKTTLIRAILRQLRPTSGQIVTHPKQIEYGYVPQFRNVDPDYPLSIKSFVGLTRLKHRLPFYLPKEHQALVRVLKRTNLVQIQNSRLGKASGGEKQRAYLAQALINEPDLLILDESTASLDVQAKNELMQLVRHLNETEALTVIFITHDFELAKQYTKKFAFLHDGALDTGAIEDLTDDFLMKHV
ncbi:metal ABC transporter ATP-binding protein [Agrilactobacillus yilanensis]|uniref:Metal ABC transporter ATP-binding protein n=1 Tax=Agrilactobacillus yilanensis TaxID=2485997 RepID=A0ABW4J7V7_9LACO|nr:ATP-binding cassette domain-containing protein [Agrilactobacillus yilanensis]